MAAEPRSRAQEELVPLRSARFECFDGLRAIAALCVVGIHVGTVSRANADAWFGIFTSHLNIGVAIFFLISGFLLYRPHAVESFGGPPAHRLRDYTSRRLLRIVPAYWVALTLLAIWPGLQGVFTHDWWVYYGFLQSYDAAWRWNGLAIAWSLSVEVAFYAALPLLALGARSICRGRGASWNLRVQLGGLAVLALASLLFTAWTMFRGPWAGWTLPALFVWFALGMGLAVASARMGGRERDFAFARWVAEYPSACWVLALALFAWVGISPMFPRAFAPLPVSPFAVTLERLLYGVISLLVLLPAVFGEERGGWPRRLLTNRWLSWVGKISYAVFLWHHPLLMVMTRYGVGDWIPGYPFLSFSLAILPVSLLVGWASFRLIEMPAMRLRTS